MFFSCNVKHSAEIQKGVKLCVDTFGHLDYGINCAGLEGERAVIHESTEENFKHVMDTNALGVYMSMKYELEQVHKSVLFLYELTRW